MATPRRERSDTNGKGTWANDTEQELFISHQHIDTWQNITISHINVTRWTENNKVLRRDLVTYGNVDIVLMEHILELYYCHWMDMSGIVKTENHYIRVNMIAS